MEGLRDAISDDRDSISDDRDAISDDRDSISDDSSDESSSRVPKVRRLEQPEDDIGFIEVAEDVFEDFKVGYRLLEVFSVQFVDYQQVNLAEIYGTLMLDCAFTPYVLFERFPGDPLPVDSNGFVKLTGPSRTHLAYDRIQFVNFLCDLEGSVERSHVQLWYGSHDGYLRLFNKLLFKRLNTKFGPVEIIYTIFTVSAGAVLEVKLLEWKDKGKHNGNNAEIEVFGAVTARSKLIPEERGKSYMFKREKEMCALVRPGEALPLSRHVVVFPVKSSILLDVHLCHPSDNDSTSGADDLILSGRVEIPATRRGEEFVLEGDSARIQLKIQGDAKGTNVMEYLKDAIWDDSFSRVTNARHLKEPENNNSRIQRQFATESTRVKRRLVEVFSVRFCAEFWGIGGSELYGFSLIEPLAGQCRAVLLSRKSYDPPLLTEQGLVKLNGPMHGIEVKDKLVVDSYLWGLHAQPLRKHADTLWRAGVDEIDRFICKEVSTDSGPQEVTFAVYSDGVEAHLEVALVDWKALDGDVLEAFGTIDSGNSKMRDTRVRSRLFDRSIDEVISVKPGKDVTNLSLSRSVTVVPRESTLLVDVIIWQLSSSDLHQDPIFQMLSFDPNLTRTQTKVASGDCGNVQVRVTFSQ